MECVPRRMALSEMTLEAARLAGAFGPALSMGGRIECRLLDDDIVGVSLRAEVVLRGLSGHSRP